MDKYTEAGIAQFKMPDMLKLPPIIQYGNTLEIAGKFSGGEKLRKALDNLQAMLYTG